MDKATLQNLADLARLEPTEAELDSLLTDIPAILDYVGQLRDVATPDEIGWHGHELNKTNPDEVDSYDDPVRLVEQSAKHRDRYVEVPKIMNTSNE